MVCSVQPNSLTGRATTMNKYLVKLTPLGKYFFGGDMTFKSGRKKDNDDEKYGSYIIHSFKTPQQTSLLGMMRFLLLSNDERAFDVKSNRIKNKAVADTLIGEKSFCVSEGHKANNFGKISSIGPCFLYNTEDKKAYFRILSPDWQIAFADAPVKAVINGAEVELPEIWVNKNGKEEAYTGKDGMDICYAPLDKSHVLKEEELFTEDSRIGIAKNDKGRSDSSAFYKQISYRLKKGFCFAFEVETEVNLMGYRNRLVQLGADSSGFLLEVEQKEVGYPRMEDDLQVALVSDAYIESAEGLGIRFAVTRIRPFRFLHSGNSTESKDYNTKYKSNRNKKRYDLYEAGSVFYFKDKDSRDAFCEYLGSYKEFTQIGYNQYCR